MANDVTTFEKITRSSPFLPAKIMLSSYITINTFGRCATYSSMRLIEAKQREGKFTPAAIAWGIRPQRALMLIISFAERSLRQLCENEEETIDSFGDEAANKLRARLADLRAAENVANLPFGMPYEIQGTEEHCLAMEFFEGYRLVFCANHNKNPKLESGKADWSKIYRVKILEIESDHDGK